MGVEVAIGALIAWMVGKARRVGKTLDGVADEVVDVGAAKLRDVVLGKLGGDPAVRKLLAEITTEAGEVSDRTRRRVMDAIAAAAEDDDTFRKDLATAIAAAQRQGGLLATHSGTAVSGTAHALGQGSVAIGAVGHDVNLGQPLDPHQPGRA